MEEEEEGSKANKKEPAKQKEEKSRPTSRIRQGEREREAPIREGKGGRKEGGKTSFYIHR